MNWQKKTGFVFVMSVLTASSYIALSPHDTNAKAERVIIPKRLIFQLCFCFGSFEVGALGGGAEWAGRKVHPDFEEGKKVLIKETNYCTTCSFFPVSIWKGILKKTIVDDTGDTANLNSFKILPGKTFFNSTEL